MKNLFLFLFIFVGLSINAQTTKDIKKFLIEPNNQYFSFFIDNSNPLIDGKKKILTEAKTVYKGSLDDFNYKRSYKSYGEATVAKKFIAELGFEILGKIAQSAIDKGVESLLTPKRKRNKSSNVQRGKGIRN